MSNPFMPNLSPQQISERDDAMNSIRMLADQVGIKCAQCGTIMRGHENICAVSYMAPMGTQEYQARAYCEPCAQAMFGD